MVTASAASALSIVIPCRNEEKAIPVVLGSVHEAIQELHRAGEIESAEVIVVDDGSTDGTAELLARTDWIRVIRLESGSGYGAALKRGFEQAQGDWIAFLDMDDTYDPKDLARLLPALRSNGTMIVQGDRLLSRQSMSPVRWIGNSLFSSMARILFKHPVRDACTGFRVFKREVLPGILALPQNHLGFSLSMTTWTLKSGVEFAEVPIRYNQRIGKSKLNVVEDGFRFLFTILGEKWERPISRS